MNEGNIRPDNLLGAMGIDFKISEEAREMQKILADEFKKRHQNLLDEVRKWRASYPKMTLEDAIRAIYKELEEEETKIIDGEKYRKVFSGYTIRQYFSHETPEKGPGPGWDYKRAMLEKHNVDNPSQLPDEPYYIWELVEDEK